MKVTQKVGALQTRNEPRFITKLSCRLFESCSGGNYGLLDQQMAIEFLVSNCERINCDPTRVTLFGESAGGESVSFQVLNEKSASMVTSGIIQSGPAMFDIQLSQACFLIELNTISN